MSGWVERECMACALSIGPDEATTCGADEVLPPEVDENRGFRVNCAGLNGALFAMA